MLFVTFLGLGNTWIHSSAFLYLIILWLHQDKHSLTKMKLCCVRQLADRQCGTVPTPGRLESEQDAARWKVKAGYGCQTTVGCFGRDFSMQCRSNQSGSSCNNHNSSSLSRYTTAVLHKLEWQCPCLWLWHSRLMLLSWSFTCKGNIFVFWRITISLGNVLGKDDLLSSTVNRKTASFAGSCQLPELLLPGCCSAPSSTQFCFLLRRGRETHIPLASRYRDPHCLYCFSARAGSALQGRQFRTGSSVLWQVCLSPFLQSRDHLKKDMRKQLTVSEGL